MNREGGYVRTDDPNHKSILLRILPQMILVGNEPPLPLDLGFEHDEALRNSQAYVNELNKLSQKVDKRLREACPPDEPDYERLEKALYLSKGDVLSTLTPLRKIGSALRAELSPNILAKLDYYDFRFCVGEVSGELQLTFQESKKAPILWEMLYESAGEKSILPEWQRFWGFGVPITHWTQDDRIPTIQLSNGLFSAIHEGLPFASSEEQALKACLQKHFQRELLHYSLKQELYKQVYQTLQSKLCEEELNAWWKGCPEGFWLQRFLEEMEPDEEIREYIIQAWKEDILLAICRRGFTQGLIHFACHCQPNERTEFLSRLIMKVAGEEIPLDVSTMVTRLEREKTEEGKGPKFYDPGSLVFLNACGTAQALTTYEPPGFPDKWISCQRALAVVATVCPVPDYFAHAFALKFYEILFACNTSAASDKTHKDASGSNASSNASSSERNSIPPNRYIANALLETRRYFMAKYKNPLGLAYILYAVKDAYIQIDPV